MTVAKIIFAFALSSKLRTACWPIVWSVPPRNAHETCVRAQYHPISGQCDIVKSMNPWSISQYGISDMNPTQEDCRSFLTTADHYAFLPQEDHRSQCTCRRNTDLDLGARAEAAKVQPKNVWAEAEPNFSWAEAGKCLSQPSRAEKILTS